MGTGCVVWGGPWGALWGAAAEKPVLACACEERTSAQGANTSPSPASPAPLIPTPQVSHDLRELAPLVDAAWEMRPGGRLAPSSPERLPFAQL